MNKMSKKSGGILMAVILAIYGAICAWVCFDMTWKKLKQRIAEKIAVNDWGEEIDDYYRNENGEWCIRPVMDGEFEVE